MAPKTILVVRGGRDLVGANVDGADVDLDVVLVVMAAIDVDMDVFGEAVDCGIYAISTGIVNPEKACGSGGDSKHDGNDDGSDESDERVFVEFGVN